MVRLGWLSILLARLINRRKEAAALTGQDWCTTKTYYSARMTFRNRIHRAPSMLALDDLDFTPHCLQYGGASTAYMEGVPGDKNINALTLKISSRRDGLYSARQVAEAEGQRSGRGATISRGYYRQTRCIRILFRTPRS